MVKIRRGDLVQVMTGSDRGRRGRVVAVHPETGRVRVEKVRLQKRHLKPGRKGARAGGIVEQEGYIDASNVMLVNPDGHVSRVRMQERDGVKVRVFAVGGAEVPEPL